MRRNKNPINAKVGDKIMITGFSRGIPSISRNLAIGSKGIVVEIHLIDGLRIQFADQSKWWIGPDDFRKIDSSTPEMRQEIIRLKSMSQRSPAEELLLFSLEENV